MARSKRARRAAKRPPAKSRQQKRPSAKPRPPKQRPTKRSPTKRSPAKRPPAQRAPTTQPPERSEAVAPPESPSPSPAETDLLTLARTLTELTSSEFSPRGAMTTALDALAAAFEADAPLPRALAHARNAALADHAQALALAWAREQLRLSLGEILSRAAATGDVRVSFPADSLGWLVLAACEALAHEPRGAAPDRLRVLAEWLTGD